MPQPPQAVRAAPAPVVLATATDCAGGPMTVEGLPEPQEGAGDSQTAGEYRRVRVVAADGHLLLTVADPHQYRAVQFVRAGAPAPILLLSSGVDAPASVHAYLCAAGSHTLAPLKWDDADALAGRITAADERELQAVLAQTDDPAGEVPVVYRFEQGQLRVHIADSVRAQMVVTQQLALAPDLKLAVWRQPPTQGGATNSGRNLVTDSGPLLVTDSAGRVLLDQPRGVLQVVGLRDVGAPYPVLLTRITGGGSMGEYYHAYLYEPAEQRLRQLTWNQQPIGISRADVEQGDHSIKTTGRRPKEGEGWQTTYTVWAYRGGALAEMRTGDEPGTTTPATTKLAPPPSADPHQMLIERDKGRFRVQGPLLSPPPALVRDLQDLRWVALRGGAGIEVKPLEMDAKDVPAIAASEQDQAQGGLRYVRLYYDAYTPGPGENDAAHRDVIVFVDAREKANAYLGIQSPADLQKWQLTLLPGYGPWLTKEIDIYLRVAMGM